MIVEFEDQGLKSLYWDPTTPHPRMGVELVRAYRKVVGLLHAATDDRELRNFKALHLEQLKGDRKGQSSLRLHRGGRLIVRFRTDPVGRVVVVIEIVDYHR